MPQRKKAGKEAIATWMAESLRVTAFPLKPVSNESENWWQKVVGELPENKRTQVSKGLHQEDGPFGGGKLTLTSQPPRIDWNFTVTDDQRRDAEGLPALGPFPEALDCFLPVILSWSEVCPQVNRLAFGAILMQPVENREAGYRKLAGYLPAVKIDPKHSSDFFYQINRRRNSKTKVSGLKINRLSKWSVGAYERGQISIVGPQISARSFGTGLYACRVELDINTLPDVSRESLPDKLGGIFRELIELGAEIAEKGDIP